MGRFSVSCRVWAARSQLSISETEATWSESQTERLSIPAAIILTFWIGQMSDSVLFLKVIALSAVPVTIFKWPVWFIQYVVLMKVKASWISSLTTLRSSSLEPVGFVLISEGDVSSHTHWLWPYSTSKNYYSIPCIPCFVWNTLKKYHSKCQPALGFCKFQNFLPFNIVEIWIKLTKNTENWFEMTDSSHIFIYLHINKQENNRVNVWKFISY